MNTFPNADAAERAILACCMLDDVADKAVRMCSAKWFSNGKYAYIFNIIREMAANGLRVDLTTVASYTKQVSVSADELMAIVMDVPNASKLDQYVRVVKEKAIQRKIISEAQALINEVNTDAPVDVEYILQGLRGRFPSYDGRDELISFAELAEMAEPDLRRWMDGDQGNVYPTGITAIDSHFSGGLRRGLHVIGGRPHDGKTKLGTDMAKGMAKCGVRVRFDQLELRREEQFQKMVAEDAGGWRGKMIQGKMDPVALWSACERVAKLPIVASRKSYTVDQLRMSCEMHRHKFDVLFIDQFSEIKFRRGFRNALDEREYILNELKEISIDLDLPIILLAQLNRESTKNTEPQMSDFKNCGAIEEAADVIWLLRRPNRGVNGAEDYLHIYQRKDRIMERVREYRLSYVDGALQSK